MHVLKYCVWGVVAGSILACDAAQSLRTIAAHQIMAGSLESNSKYKSKMWAMHARVPALYCVRFACHVQS